MAFSSEQLLDHLYYKKLPQVYRDMDAMLKTYPLKRYLASLIEGGYSEVLKDTDGILDLVDPEKCPSKFLPYLCESFGLEYFEDMDDTYQRRFLVNIGEILKRRGTYACVRYLVRVLTGLDVDLRYERGYNEDKYGRWLFVELQGVNIDQILQIDTSIKVIERYVGTQIPYFITAILSASIAMQILQVKKHMGYAMGQGVYAKILPFKSKSESLDMYNQRVPVISAGRDGLIVPFKVVNSKELLNRQYYGRLLVQDLNSIVHPFRNNAVINFNVRQYLKTCISSGSSQYLMANI